MSSPITHTILAPLPMMSKCTKSLCLLSVIGSAV